MTYNPRDHFFKKAKKEGFAARSVFKLEEIDQKCRILNVGDRVIDLGCSPGSWSQYASRKIGERGRIFGVDLTEMQISLPNAQFLTADIHNVNFAEWLGGVKADVVISDMAPNTTGIKSVDQDRSVALCEMALFVAEQWLKKDGHFACKIFQSGDFNQFRTKMRGVFHKVEIVKPKSTREISKEIFLVGIKKK